MRHSHQNIGRMAGRLVIQPRLNTYTLTFVCFCVCVLCVSVCLFCVFFLCMFLFFVCASCDGAFPFFPSFFICPISSLVLTLLRPAATTATTASRCPTHKCTRGILRTAWRSSSSSRKCFQSEKFSTCCLRATLLSKPHE